MNPPRPWLRIIVEGVVIVGSILLAFGIDAWWDGEQDRRAASEYVVRLTSDLQEDISRWQEQSVNNARKQESLARVLEWVRADDQTLESGARLLDDFTTSTHLAYGEVAIQSQRSTFDELISTGGLRSLSPLLRELLLNYYRQTEFRGALLSARETGYASRIFDIIPRDPAEDRKAFPGLTEEERLDVVRRLRLEDLEGSMVGERNLAIAHLGSMRALLSLGEQVLLQLEREGH
jgi:hypothetical protein